MSKMKASSQKKGRGRTKWVMMSQGSRDTNNECVAAYIQAHVFGGIEDRKRMNRVTEKKQGRDDKDN